MVIERRARPRGRAGGRLTGSWTRTLAALAVLVAVAVAVGGLAISGRFGGDLRYANIPWLRPWPPSGWVVNTYDPTNRGDIIKVAEANQVRKDLLADGKVEVDAFAHGQADPLAQALTGRALAKATQSVLANSHAGLFEQGSSKLDSIEVGHLADPNEASIQWAVEERGVSTLSFIDQATGQVARQESFRFDGKFWLTKVGGHYLIVDVGIQRLS